ncbi:hypothetical protein AAVH_03705 [Aphelenchoides avenae]|nr:hypothetical protein AAVH_03705 [Aphelenchus avenae]
MHERVVSDTSDGAERGHRREAHSRAQLSRPLTIADGGARPNATRERNASIVVTAACIRRKDHRIATKRKGRKHIRRNNSSRQLLQTTTSCQYLKAILRLTQGVISQIAIVQRATTKDSKAMGSQ